MQKYYPKFHHWFMVDLDLRTYLEKFEPEWTKINYITKNTE